MQRHEGPNSDKRGEEQEAARQRKMTWRLSGAVFVLLAILGAALLLR